MKISVVMSAYNGEKYIGTQLETLRKQTRVPDEVIICDDGSSDRTVSIVQDYIRENGLTHWVCRRNEKNLGWRVNFQTLIAQAQGELIFTCDQDDIWHPQKIEIMARIMEENEKIRVLGCGFATFQEDGEADCQAVDPGSVGLCELRLSVRKPLRTIPGCMMCLRRDIVPEMLRFQSDMLGHDALIQTIAKAHRGMYLCQEKLVYWRIHRESSFSREVHGNKRAFYPRKFQAREAYLDIFSAIVQEKNHPDRQRMLRDVEKIRRWCRDGANFWQNPSVKAYVAVARHIAMYARFRDWAREMVDMGAQLIRK